MESAVAVIEAMFGFGGPDRMLAAGRRAVELETASGPYHAVAHMALGHAAYIAGDLELAAEALTEAVQTPAAPVVTRMLALCLHSLVDSERGRALSSRMLAERAQQIGEEHDVLGAPEASMIFTALAEAASSSRRPRRRDGGRRAGLGPPPQ